MLICIALLLGATNIARAADAIEFDDYELVDLSHSYDKETIYWPTSPTAFELKQLSYGVTEAGYFYAANSFSTPEHGGTHIDAPIHFAEHGWHVAEIPLERLMGTAIVIDISSQAKHDRDYRLTVADVESFEKAHGKIEAGAMVLLRTDFSKYWPDAARYLGSNTPGDASDLHFPGYGEAATRLLVEQRKVKALGIDTASIDFGPSTNFIVHQIVGANSVLGFENLTNLDKLSAVGSSLIALPMKIGGGSGAPLRVVALLPK